ncbi:MAG: hypothetical protein OXI39_07780 [Gemmatimonadota bacterium]|uniref:ArnT family glycosyltransferase n=1 Tax=Candidatus Palauibacter scopulicola TaxID=3056741 RepID=UPI002392E966|nr:hypothetical protein [Candidatus Palauibacter scopulicola]MDE2662887.1 hypothetical protein [Candidatus Palauibacter scopulicola]
MSESWSRDRIRGVLSSRTVRTIGALAALHLLLCAVLFDPKIHTGGDSATYVLLAESILRAGDGFALSMAPGAPEAHTHYPPGYPILLAPAVALFGRNFVVLKLLSVLFTTASVVIFCLYARGGRERAPWWCIGLAFAVNPGVIDYSRWILSEAPFLLFTLVALWALREDGKADRMGPVFVVALLASVASFYVRSIGALLLAGTSIAYLVHRRWPRLIVHGLVGSALTIPWLLRNRYVADSASPYFAQFRLANVYTPEAGYLDLAGFAGRFLENLWLYASREMPRALVGSDSPWAQLPIVSLAGIAVCVLALLGLTLAFRKPGAAEFYAVFMGLAILLFQESVNDVRYLVPLLPLVLVYVFDTVGLLTRQVRRRPFGFSAPAAAMIALAGVGLWSAAARAPANTDMIRRYGAGDPYAGYHPAWRNFFEAAAWVEENTPGDAVVTVRKPRLFHALTGRRVRMYPLSTPDSVLAVVRSTDFVVLDPIHGTNVRYLLPGIQQAPEAFFPVHETGEPTTHVLGVRNEERP